jgi:murein DD-endopeptidase MepM/ murein hydrolase activator NlpD
MEASAMKTPPARRLALVSGLVLGLLAAPSLASAQVVRGAVPPGPPPPSASATTDGPAWGTYRWPVHGPVIRPFEEPANPYGSGHRGIDIAAPFGTAIRAPADGTVSFAGTVAGSLFISIDHDGGIRTSYSWVSAIAVKKGQTVAAGAVIGRTGQGHPGSDRTHLHFSARLNGTYIDPMLLLGGGNLDDIIHLAEWDR